MAFSALRFARASARGEKTTTMMLGRVLVSAMALAALAGCRGQTSRDTPLFGIRNMYDQPKYIMQGGSEFFDDHRAARPLVEGVIAHDQEVDPEIALGRLEDQSGYVLETPKAVIERNGGMEALLAQGKERYGIYCTPCHDSTGSGEGLVKLRAVAGGAAAFVPPTFHQDRIRHMPDGQLYAVIANGRGNMPAYAAQIPVDERWAIVQYVRALQIAHPELAAPAAPMPTAIPGATDLPAPGGKESAPPTPDDAAPEAPPAAPETQAPDTQQELEKNP